MNDQEPEQSQKSEPGGIRFSWAGFLGAAALFGGVTVVFGMHPSNDPLEMGLMYPGGAALVGFLFPIMTGSSE